MSRETISAAAAKMSQLQANSCLLQAKREHVKSQCTKESKCKGRDQILSLLSRCWPGF